MQEHYVHILLHIIMARGASVPPLGGDKSAEKGMKLTFLRIPVFIHLKEQQLRGNDKPLTAAKLYLTVLGIAY